VGSGCEQGAKAPGVDLGSLAGGCVCGSAQLCCMSGPGTGCLKAGILGPLDENPLQPWRGPQEFLADLVASGTLLA
jgi:hypothetical protein